jgi:hypothetical protein
LPVTVIIKEPTMPTYISLIKYTQQGISTIKDGPGRLDANKEILNTLRARRPAMTGWVLISSMLPAGASLAQVPAERTWPGCAR